VTKQNTCKLPSTKNRASTTDAFLKRFAVGEMTLKVTEGHWRWTYSIDTSC